MAQSGAAPRRPSSPACREDHAPPHETAHALKVAQPPCTIALLHPGKPAACGIEHDHHQEPDRVDSSKAIAIVGGLVRQMPTQEPAHLSGRPPYSDHRQHMN